MKPMFVFAVTLSLFVASKSSPLGQDGRKEDLLIQCLVEVLTKAVTKQDGTSLQPQCNDILQKHGSGQTLLMKKNEELVPLEQDEKRQEKESNVKAKEIINELLRTNEEKREDIDDERSQEEFPNYYKRHHLLTSIEKREDPDYERSQEEFPQKRQSLFSTKKREYLDEDRSQEYFPTYEQRRHLFLTSKDKRDEPDYDRSQEDFPSYVYKRYHDEDVGTEKQIWKQYDDTINEDFGKTNSQEKRFDDKESVIQYWNPSQHYHHKKHHKHGDDSSDEEMESAEKERRVPWTKGLEEQTEESEERGKKIWNPSYKTQHMKFFDKQGKFENENDANQHSLETSKRRSPEEEELIAQELNENKHYYDSQEEQKRHHNNPEEKKQEEEAELRYLIKKRNELEERLLKDGEVYDKHNPWIYRGYYNPSWYKQSTDGNEGLVGPSQKLQELANTLKYKMGLLSEKESSEGEKAYLHQRALTPEELKELEKLASIEKQAQIN